MMEYKKINVTALSLEQKKAVTFTADMKALCKCQTEAAVKKALEKQILDSKVFQKEDLPKLKYQGREEVVNEWKSARSVMEEENAAHERTLFALANDYHSDYDLKRFLTAQESDYPIALAEIRNGRKTGHWIWYIFPQQKGLGYTYNSEFYGLDGLEEAKAYVQHPVLGYRLREICHALLEHKGKDIRYIMGTGLDALKLKTSMELFNHASPNDVFETVLRTFF